MDSRQIEAIFFVAVLLGTAFLAFFIARPYLDLVIFAGVLAVMFDGVNRRITAVLRSRSFAAFITTLLVLVTVVTPLTFIGYQIARESSVLYSGLTGQSAADYLSGVSSWLQRIVARTAPGLVITPAELASYVQTGLSWIVGNLGNAFASAARLLFSFFLVLLFFYYLVRDGHALIRRAQRLSPLSDKRESFIISRIGQSVTAVIRGQLVVALVQGIVSGLGFAFFQVPNPVLWGTVAAVAAFIPTLGTALVSLPIILYLYFNGLTTNAIGLALWASLAVGLVDNVLGPKLIGSGSRIHPLLVMVSVLGGLAFFGPLGFIIGPIVMSVLIALLDIWTELHVS